MKLQINVPVTGLDLANLLEGDEGVFLCQNRGQIYITGAVHGHSIAFGPTPIGRPIREAASPSLATEPWVVTKITDSTENYEELATQLPVRNR